MRIVVDATAAVRQRAGVGRFARGLLSGLSALDTHNQYVLLTTGKAVLEADQVMVPARHRWLRLPVPERAARIAWQRLRIAPSPLLLTRHADLFFTPDFALPPLGGVPGIMTVHDLSFLVHPECADAGLQRYLATVVPRSIQQAAAVIAVSETTARALIGLLGVPRERIAVVYNGVDSQFIQNMPATGGTSHEEEAADLARRFGLSPGYLLTVGTLEPRKNLVRLLHAFACLRDRHSRARSGAGGSGSKPVLVIVGREGWLYEPIFLAVARLGLGRSVRFLTRADDVDLALLYRQAGAFVYPSLYEGFGLPPLEAMACGMPVAASTGGALAEVLGDAALPFDPLDVDAMAAAMERVLYDTELRACLVERGRARAASYTWDDAARVALGLFERVAA